MRNEKKFLEESRVPFLPRCGEAKRIYFLFTNPYQSGAQLSALKLHPWRRISTKLLHRHCLSSRSLSRFPPSISLSLSFSRGVRHTSVSGRSSRVSVPPPFTRNLSLTLAPPFPSVQPIPLPRPRRPTSVATSLSYLSRTRLSSLDSPRATLLPPSYLSPPSSSTNRQPANSRNQLTASSCYHGSSNAILLQAS